METSFFYFICFLVRATALYFWKKRLCESRDESASISALEHKKLICVVPMP
jgi:hypothetical protein